MYIYPKYHIHLKMREIHTGIRNYFNKLIGRNNENVKITSNYDGMEFVSAAELASKSPETNPFLIEEFTKTVHDIVGYTFFALTDLNELRKVINKLAKEKNIPIRYIGPAIAQGFVLAIQNRLKYRLMRPNDYQRISRALTALKITKKDQLKYGIEGVKYRFQFLCRLITDGTFINNIEMNAKSESFALNHFEKPIWIFYDVYVREIHSSDTLHNWYSSTGFTESCVLITNAGIYGKNGLISIEEIKFNQIRLVKVINESSIEIFRGTTSQSFLLENVDAYFLDYLISYAKKPDNKQKFLYEV